MMWLTIGRTAGLTVGRLTSIGRRTACATLEVVAFAAVVPGRADAQFGILKKLMHPKAATSARDSARVKDNSASSGMTALSATAGDEMPDTQSMLAFQQSMTKLSMEATTGSASARAKLDAWQRMSEQFETAAAKLNPSIAAGDTRAHVKLQSMQAKLVRDWLAAYGVAPTKAAPVRKP